MTLNSAPTRSEPLEPRVFNWQHTVSLLKYTIVNYLKTTSNIEKLQSPKLA